MLPQNQKQALLAMEKHEILNAIEKLTHLNKSSLLKNAST
jgi:hypothetical protein